MKKYLILLVIFITTACSTDEQIIKSQSKIGLPTYPLSDLYIPEDEQGWQYYQNGLGLRTQENYIVRKTTTNDTLVDYSCWIANKLPINPTDYYTGQYDFVCNPEEDGIYNESSNSYNFPGMLSITTFCPDESGYYLPIGEVIKQRFRLIPTDFRQELDPYSIIIYNEPLMALQTGTADNYDNKAKVKAGKNLVVVEINPDLEITERDYTNNVSTLPLNVTFQPIQGNVVGSAVIDLSIITENKTAPPSNIIITKKFTGKEKYIKIDFHCPYHDNYVKHYFTVKKNGVVVEPKLLESEYKETITGNYRTATYEITTTVIGLGTSLPTTVTINR